MVHELVAGSYASMAAKRTDELFGRHLAAGHVDPAAVRARRAPASRCRHPLFRNTPRVVHGIVLLHHIRVGSGQDEAVAGAAADDVDLAVDDTAERVVARHCHRPAALPLVRGGVVHVVGAENPRRSEEREERILGRFHRRDAADHVDLAADFDGHRSPALAGQRRERLPGIRRRIVLPRVVDGFPCGAGWNLCTRRGDEAPAHVDLAVRSGQGRMVGRPRHRLLLRPFVGGRVVLVGGAPSLALAPAADHVQFVVDGNAVEFFIRFRERCRLFPGRCRHLSQRGRGEHQAGDHGQDRGSPLSQFRHGSLLSMARTRSPSPAAGPLPSPGPPAPVLTPTAASGIAEREVCTARGAPTHTLRVPRRTECAEAPPAHIRCADSHVPRAERHPDRWLASRIAVVLARSDVGEFPKVIVGGREV